MHESVAMEESLVGHIPSKENVADLMTKSFMGKREDIWSVSHITMQPGKLDPTYNSINLEGTRKMWLFIRP